jgi:hypothetical protein
MAHHVTRVERYWVDAIMRGDDDEFGTQDITGSWHGRRPSVFVRIGDRELSTRCGNE